MLVVIAYITGLFLGVASGFSLSFNLGSRLGKK